ncbi:MAG: ParB/RepB/Spo0J family partition protein [Cyanobacteria bacterium J06628_6]
MPAKRDTPYNSRIRFSPVEDLLGMDTAPTQEIPVNNIQVSPHQPRTTFDPAKLKSLAASIETDGILQPLLVRITEKKGVYELIAGERRLRAARMVQLDQVPVVIVEVSAEKAAQLALVENLQREDLNPIEETEGILNLIALRLEISPDTVPSLLYRLQNQATSNANHNVMANPEHAAVEAIFQAMGGMSWQSFVKNRLPLLNLPDEILEAVRSGQLAYSKATVIARLKDPKARQQLLKKALKAELSLTQIRTEIQALQPAAPAAEATPRDPHKRLQQMSRVAQKSPAFDDPKKKQRIIKLLDQLETLLKD